MILRVVAPPAIIVLALIAFAVSAAWPSASAEDFDAPPMDIIVDTVAPRAGGTVEITAKGFHLGQTIYATTLVITQPDPPVFAIVSHDSFDAPWTLEALRPGKASLQFRGDFEKYFPCPTTAPPLSCGADFYPTSFTKVSMVVDGDAGDADCNATIQSLDALLLLQLDAALLDSLPCADISDMNRDCLLDALDAALVLQTTASLILPPQYHPC